MICAYGLYNRFRMVCITFSLTNILFSFTRFVCNRNIWVICSGLTISFVVVADLTMYEQKISMQYYLWNFNKFRLVCINFSLTIIWFSHNRSIYDRHIRLICNGLTLIFVFFNSIQTLFFSMKV